MPMAPRVTPILMTRCIKRGPFMGICWRGGSTSSQRRTHRSNIHYIRESTREAVAVEVLHCFNTKERLRKLQRPLGNYEAVVCVTATLITVLKTLSRPCPA